MATRRKSDGGATVDHTKLTPFDGREVASASIAVTNAGDGLSTAMQVEPREYAIGDIVDVLLRCEVSKVGHVEIKDTQLLNRVHTLKAGVGTIVDREFADAAITAQAQKNEEAKGILSLDLNGDDPTEDE